MVASINPSATGASALGAETRTTRPQLTLPQKQQTTDGNEAARVTISDAAAAWRSAQASVSDGLAAIDLALAIGRDALLRLNEIGEAARGGQDPQAAIDAYAAVLDDAQSPLLLGDNLEIDAEPGGAPFTIAGADIRLGALITLPANADGVASAVIARAAQDGAAALLQHLTRLESAARSLEAHAGFLDAAGGEGRDVDADGARLLALQVSQDLSAAGAAIANAQPQAVLSLFKA